MELSESGDSGLPKRCRGIFVLKMEDCVLDLFKNRSVENDGMNKEVSLAV